MFGLFLFGFYFLYVVIDYSMHVQDLTLGKHLSIFKIGLYYLLQFVKRMDILLPLALLISAIKVLCSFNLQNELLALQSAGLRMKKLLTPFLWIGAFLVGINLAVNQFIVPYSLEFIDRFHNAHFRHSFRGNRIEPLHVMHLKDRTKLIYQFHDTAKNAFFDVIWIKSPTDLWRMRYLEANPQTPLGEWVDHIQKKEDGSFEKTRSYDQYIFDQLEWDPSQKHRGLVPYENRSIEKLWQITRSDPLLTYNERQEATTQFLFKLAMPFLSVLVFLAVAPFCIRHAKDLPQFLLSSVGVFSLVAFIALMDAAVILGESNTVSPYIAILSPFIFLFGIFGWRYIRA
jgi:lipopolysaccharide export system permease protein